MNKPSILVVEDDVRLAGGSVAQGGLPVGGGEVAVIVGFQGGGDQIADGDVILHHQKQGFIHGALPPEWEV